MFLNDFDKVEIELTTICNARCPMCSRQIEETCIPDNIPNHSITEKQIKKLTFKNKQVVLSGTFGDPLANPEALEIITHLAKYNNVGIDTNASLRSTTFWAKLAKIKNVSVIFSIDGLEDTNHIYRVGTNFNKIIKNAKTFIDNGGYAIWKFNVFNFNEHQIEEAQLLSKELGFKLFKIEHSTRWLSESYTVNGHNIAPSSEALKQSHKFKYNIPLVDVTSNISCRYQKQKNFFISADFKLLPCCYFNVDRWKNKDFNDYWSNTKEGFNDLDKYSIEEIFNSEYYTRTLVNSWKDNTCWNSCKRICNTNTYWDKSTIREKK